jgi:hypothetical protein
MFLNNKLLAFHTKKYSIYKKIKNKQKKIYKNDPIPTLFFLVFKENTEYFPGLTGGVRSGKFLILTL